MSCVLSAACALIDVVHASSVEQRQPENTRLQAQLAPAKHNYMQAADVVTEAKSTNSTI